MESRQSDARNKVIAPVFKRLGIIDQWGNGLKLIADEMKEYPNIELRWREVGLSFQVQFVRLDYMLNAERIKDVQQELQKTTLYSEVLRCIVSNALSRQDISLALGQKKDKLSVLTVAGTCKENVHGKRIMHNLFLRDCAL